MDILNKFVKECKEQIENHPEQIDEVIEQLELVKSEIVDMLFELQYLKYDR